LPLSALAAVLAVGTAASPNLEAHPSSPPPAGRIYDALSVNLRGWSVPSAELAVGTALTVVPTRAASATSPLDLHKLTMSDFGDVEQSR
jgi:hypothetical protein